MAVGDNVFCNQSLTTGNNDGTDFDTHAFQTLALMLNASNLGVGEFGWVKNDASIAASTTFSGFSAANQNPPNLIGCISTATGSTGTPPTAAMIVPGLRNGSSTRAYDQTAGNSPPTVTITDAFADITIKGVFAQVYGLVFIANDDINLISDQAQGVWEECEFKAGNSGSSNGDILLGGPTVSDPMQVTFKNCKLHSAGPSGCELTTGNKLGRFDFIGCEIDFISGVGQLVTGGATMSFIGCDFSASSSTIIGNSTQMTPQGRISINNCKINASSALVNGTIGDQFEYWFIGTSSASGKGTGQSFQEIELVSRQGNITQETSRVRTNGADDGASGGWALAFTPNINETRDNTLPLHGPPMAIEVTGDGTAQTVTVFIANSGASDYNNDDVWMEVTFPSASGTADHDYETTQMDLEATPSAIADDTVSVWGSGASNRQKLTASISPDYDGFVVCTVFFAKNFGSSPETLYVDPLPVLS